MEKRIAVITGVSRGIGQAVALNLLSRSFTVVGISRSDRTKIDRSLISSPHFTYIEADLTSADGLMKVKDVISKCGNVEILLNNAGILPVGKLQDLPWSTFDEVLSTNVAVPMKLSSICLPLMKAGSRILNVSSRAGSVSVSDVGSYCMSKAALDMFTRCLRGEVAAGGVGVW
jgi:benzil reductase ((S)-benzoin forming)